MSASIQGLKDLLENTSLKCNNKKESITKKLRAHLEMSTRKACVQCGKIEKIRANQHQCSF